MCLPLLGGCAREGLGCPSSPRFCFWPPTLPTQPARSSDPSPDPEYGIGSLRTPSTPVPPPTPTPSGSGDLKGRNRAERLQL